MQKDKGLDLGAEPPRIKLCLVPSPPPRGQKAGLFDDNLCKESIRKEPITEIENLIIVGFCSSSRISSHRLFSVISSY